AGSPPKRSSSGRVETAEQRAPGVVGCGRFGPKLLLALADRNVFQTAEKSGPASGAMGATDRTGHCAAVADREHGLRGGLGFAKPRRSSRRRFERHSDPPERSPNESRPTAHRVRVAGGVV